MLSRRQFLELPIEDVLALYLDGPVLRFPFEHQARAACLQAELDHCREMNPTTREGERRRNYAAQRAYWDLVKLAHGYAWPGMLRCEMIAFADA